MYIYIYICKLHSVFYFYFQFESSKYRNTAARRVAFAVVGHNTGNS